MVQFPFLHAGRSAAALAWASAAFLSASSDIVRNRAALVRIGDRVTQVCSDIGRFAKALTIEAPIFGRERGVSGAEFRDRIAVSQSRFGASHVVSFHHAARKA
jgi:hypothetical protein